MIHSHTTVEKQLLTELKGVLKEDKMKRFREIEVQSQGTRLLLRSGISGSTYIFDKIGWQNAKWWALTQDERRAILVVGHQKRGMIRTVSRRTARDATHS